MLTLIGLTLSVLQDPPDIKILPDNSLTAEAYIERGIPAADRSWTGDDYKAALKALRKIASADPQLLPRHDSKASGLLFTRVCSADNFNLLENKQLPVASRLGEATELYGTLPALLMLYAEQRPAGTCDAEIVSLSLFLLRASVVMFALMDEFLPTIPADDPDLETRKKGVQKMRNGAALTVNGVLNMLAERSTYRPRELLRLARGLKGIVPALMPSMPPLAQKELVLRVQNMVDEEKDADMKSALKELQSALSKPAGDKPK